MTKTALGLQTLDEVPFSEASLFNFQNKLNAYFIETGINLLEIEPGGVEITITQKTFRRYRKEEEVCGQMLKQPFQSSQER